MPTNEDKMTALAKRAVACNGWRWMPGMALASTGPTTPRVLGVRADGKPWCHDGDDHAAGYIGVVTPLAPDLDDPATLGCLLALVREAWGFPEAYVYRAQPARHTIPDLWIVESRDHSMSVNDERRGYTSPLCGPSEAEALVAALAAAPQPE